MERGNMQHLISSSPFGLPLCISVYPCIHLPLSLYRSHRIHSSYNKTGLEKHPIEKPLNIKCLKSSLHLKFKAYGCHPTSSKSPMKSTLKYLRHVKYHTQISPLWKLQSGCNFTLGLSWKHECRVPAAGEVLSVCETKHLCSISLSVSFTFCPQQRQSGSNDACSKASNNVCSALATLWEHFQQRTHVDPNTSAWARVK